jgi:hypothetical protein
VAADRHEEFEERRRALKERGDELVVRLARLGSRDPHTAADLLRAEQTVASALRHSADAHLRAAAAHHRAAEAHRQAAEYADRVGEHDHAEEHRAAAKADDVAAESHTRAAEVDRAASRQNDPNNPPPPA